ncbi:hypothetical protein [Paenibacillus sp. Soil787]|uniref:hypothetical protein n=1 Tax=Paenibacillus sp. Soil787 TaxID=1736411 RepID=UPI000703AD8E|nr:hypothetical protein [Paenibacillus sp. Soil787]KRF13669.1 hypothetical protein ASG93_14260 [Paenibacillus sp. Soil787]
MKLKNKFIISMFVLILIGMVVVTSWYRHTDPLIDDGLQEVSYQGGGQKEYVIQFRNEGYGKIDIISVKTNGETPATVQLGVSYDSAALVQVLPDSDQAIKFMDIRAASIYPKLSVKEFHEALEKKVHTPIHYGLRIRYDKQPIERVTIRYKYLGFTKVKIITRWFNDGK